LTTGRWMPGQEERGLSYDRDSMSVKREVP